jgi:hypothetical protein
MAASEEGYGEIVKLLLANGANPALKTNNGETAFDVAKNSDIKDLLTNYRKNKKARNANKRSSRQGEFHPKPLTEPCLKVSLHTALLISRCKYKLILRKVGKLLLKLANPFAPLPLQELHHYYELVRHPCNL